MFRQKTLKVWPNPWHALDHLGRPAGAVSRERHGATVGHAGHLGAECVASAPLMPEKGSAASPDQDTCWHFSREPHEVADVFPWYYREKLRNGELFAADVDTARRADVKFVPLDEALATAKALAYAKWHACFNEFPEEVDPYVRPMPNGLESPADVAAASGLLRAKDAHEAVQRAVATAAADAAKQTQPVAVARRTTSTTDKKEQV